MYLTACRVRDPSGKTGINAALYLHEGSNAPAGLWGFPASERLRVVTTAHPGRRTTDRIAIPTGGNSVESYLDVVAPDGVPREAVEEALAELRGKIEHAFPELVAVEPVVATFNVNLGEREPLSRFDELRASVSDLYANPTPPEWTTIDPLVVEVSLDADRVRFRLDEASVARLALRHGRPARPMLALPSAAADEILRLYGSLYPQVAEGLTGLTRDQLLEMGGIRFIQKDEVLFVWPARP